MKIESSVYSRNMINNLPQQRQNPKADGAVTPQQNSINTTSQSVNPKNNLSSPGKVNGVEINLNNLPKKLQDVLIPEEKAMLQELFPGNGNRWGVDAYKMSTAISSSSIIGKKLDLTT